MPREDLLDNPIWSALCTAHRELALGDALARRYPPAIGPLAGVAAPSEAAFAALHPLAGAGGTLGLFLDEPFAPQAGFTLLRGGPLTQMLCATPTRLSPASEVPGMRRLTAADAAAMVALAELTEPGPFREHTHELGLFYGIFHGDGLVAMAGQRMRMPGHVEVSAVCTHPDARGRGYARTLMSAVMRDIFDGGDQPFLHTFADNHNAIRVYEALGFAARRNFQLAVVRAEG